MGPCIFGNRVDALRASYPRFRIMGGTPMLLKALRRHYELEVSE